jgi:hypothetical protein
MPYSPMPYSPRGPAETLPPLSEDKVTQRNQQDGVSPADLKAQNAPQTYDFQPTKASRRFLMITHQPPLIRYQTIFMESFFTLQTDFTASPAYD